MINIKNKLNQKSSWGVFVLGFFVGGIIITALLLQQGLISCRAPIVPPEEVDLSVFWEAWNYLEKYYINPEDLNREEMIHGAIGGMLRSSKDPHTSFFNPEESVKFRENLSGEIEGVGMEIGLKKSFITVISPLKNTPAEKAGLRPGDQIIKINDRSALDITTEEAVRLIRGPKGTEVNLSIRRPDVFEEREFILTRAVIKIPSVSWELIDQDIAYFKIHHFHEGLVRNFQAAAGEILKSSAKGLILDLRNNPGGYLEVAVDVAGWFLNRGDLVAIEELGSGQKEEFYAQGNAKLSHYPTIILINQGSASGSEILAGALRDNRGTKMVGEQSFGKGSVQQTFNLRDGSLVKITIAKWLTPDGHLIESDGLEPDVTVEMNFEDFLESGQDPQLDKALEILKETIN